jgi:hypothetical protein
VGGRSTNDVVATIIFESVSRRAFDQHAVVAMLWLEIRTTPTGMGAPLPGRGVRLDQPAPSLSDEPTGLGGFGVRASTQRLRSSGLLPLVEVGMLAG